jgi:hypothetical protein
MTEHEIITNIKKVDFKHKTGDCMTGYVIETNKQAIICAISSTDECCEDWFIKMYKFHKYIERDVEPEFSGKDFVGSKIKKIKIDEREDKKNIKTILKELDFLRKDEETFHVTLSIYTTAGVIIILLANAHNGYYPHTYQIKYNFDGKNVDDFDTL